MNENVDVMELTRIFEPEACKEADMCKERGMTPDFDTNLKIVRAMTYARKALQYIYYGKSN